MANGDPATRPRAARNGSLHGLGHGFGDKMGPRSRRGRRPNLLGAGERTGRHAPTTSPSPPEAGRGRSDVAGFSGLNVLAGIWLIIAPSVLGYSARVPRWNDVVFGIVVGLLALIRAAGGYRQHWASLVNALVGIWLFVGAFTIDHSAVAMWNDVILGAIVFALAISSTEASVNRLPRQQAGVPNARARRP